MGPALALAILLSPAQHKALDMAIEAGSPYGLEYLLPAIVYQESSFCRNQRGAHGELGCGQIKLATALTVDPDATEDRLLNDNAYNLRVAALVLDRCQHRFKSRQKILLCYHEGRQAALEMSMSDAMKHYYPPKIAEREKEIKRFKHGH